MSDADYWKTRAKLAEDEFERLQAIGTEPAIKMAEQREESQCTPEQCDKYNASWRGETQQAMRLLMAARYSNDEDLPSVARRLLGYADDRAAAIHAVRVAGYSVADEPEVQFIVKPAVERLLADLSSGRSTIDFLSRPPKLPVEALPVGAVFTTNDGRLLEVKRERLEHESLVITYQWDRNDEPRTIDRKQLVQPIGRVVFSSERKKVVLGLLELSQQALSQVVVDDPKQLSQVVAEGPKQLGGG